MADFWDFMIVAVVFWFILRIIELNTGPKKWAKWQNWTKMMEKRHPKRGMDERQGMMVGGIVCLFIGLAIMSAQAVITVPVLSGLIYLGGLVMAAIGGALLVSFVVLGMIGCCGKKSKR